VAQKVEWLLCKHKALTKNKSPGKIAYIAKNKEEKK
jgi:hypothetical protein